MLLIFSVVMAIVIYCNSLAGEFVHDDLSAITANSDVTGSGSWADFLFNDFWGTKMNDPRSHKSYRPLTILTFKYVRSIVHSFLIAFPSVRQIIFIFNCNLMAKGGITR